MSVHARPRASLFGVWVDPLTGDEVVARCQQAIQERAPLVIGVLNAAKVVRLRSDNLIRESIIGSDVVIADGQSVVWASRALGQPLPQRVAGIDLFGHLLQVADDHAYGVYLLGAKTDVLAELRTRIQRSHPGLRIVGSRDGYFADDERPDVAAEVRRSGADMLFLGMTSPKKEVFMKDFGHTLGVPVVHGVGGSFDVYAGVVTRAPLRLQRAGLEWAYRLWQEPRRMWRRYATTNSVFIYLVIKEILRRTPPYARSAHTGRAA